MKAPPIDLDEPDRIEGQPHPRETYELFGQDDALSRIARAIRGGRPPQALLLAGEPGIGKATLAYRVARYLLRHSASGDGPPDLFVPPEDLVSRQIAAQSHPGLLVLKRPWDDKGKLKSSVTVTEVRRLGEFFGLKSASGGWRIALIDSADDMNPNAANALLKSLEEPPARATLILISHVPGRLLPTIRSRVQRLDLKPLDDGLLTQMLARMAPDLGADERAVLGRLAQGSVGLALKLAGEQGAQLAEDAERLLAGSGSPDWVTTMKIADRAARRADNLELFGEFLTRSVSRRLRAQAGADRDERHAVELWEQLNALFTRAVGVNLDPRQTVLSAAALIASARRQRVT